MESGRRWIGALTAAVVFALLAPACAGKSATHDRDSGSRTCEARGDCATGGTGNGGAGGSSAGGNPAGGNVSSPIFVYDENVFRIVNELRLPTIETAPGNELEICWRDVLSDLACDDLDPLTDIDTVALLRTTLPIADLVESIANGELDMSDIDGYLSYPTDHRATCAPLSSFTLFGSEIDPNSYIDDGVHSYLFLFTRSSTPGAGSVTMVVAKPVSDSENKRLDALPGCNLVNRSADLTSARPVTIPIDGPFVVDWSQLTHTAKGESPPFTADNATVWFVPDSTATFDELKTGILAFDLIAKEIWDVPLDGTRADLALARSRADGRPFMGFRANVHGTWLFGLTCLSCGAQPLPPVLSVVEPIGP